MTDRKKLTYNRKRMVKNTIQRSKTLFSSSKRGSITLKLIIILVIIGAVALAGGIFPTVEHIDLGKKIGIPDPEAIDSGKDNLQLGTFPFKECSESVAVGLLVDTSGSMDFGQPRKIDELKKALISFSEKLTDNSVIGLYQYSVDPASVVAFQTYELAKGRFEGDVTGLEPQSATYTRRAFEYIKPRLLAAQQTYPDHEFALIFFSDGIPESFERVCEPYRCTPQSSERCFDSTQDPTVPTDIAQEIKDAGIRIYSITLLDTTDYCYNNELANMMKKIASPDSYRETSNQEDLTKIYNEITFSFCGDLR